MSDRISGFTVFEFDLPQALLESLIKLLDGMDSGVLEHSSVSEIPNAQGVYQLFLDDQLVYIGKTDAEAGLRNRLSRHAQKILHRQNLDQSRVKFKAVQILVFTAMDLESQLINHYKKLDSRPTWNDSGFGSNDPGRARETTNKRPEGFDVRYPIDIDRKEIQLTPGMRPISEVLHELKSVLPYTLRYETERTSTGRARREVTRR